MGKPRSTLIIDSCVLMGMFLTKRSMMEEMDEEEREAFLDRVAEDFPGLRVMLENDLNHPNEIVF